MHKIIEAATSAALMILGTFACLWVLLFISVMAAAVLQITVGQAAACWLAIFFILFAFFFWRSI